MFSVTHDVKVSARELNDDLRKISNWDFQWKMSFNPDVNKQAQEVIISWKTKSNIHPPLVFNNNIVSQANSQKYLGITLDFKLTFEKHLLNLFKKVNKTMGLLGKLQNLLPRTTLITIYKAFVRPHLDYGDILYDQAFNSSFHDRLESVQYNACLAIMGAIRGTSREKLYQELGLESLRLRRWYRKLCLFYKKFKNQHPEYLFHLIPVRHAPYTTRNVHNLPIFKSKHNFFKNSFFPSTISEWNKLDHSLRNSESSLTFKKNILQLMKPTANSVCNCHNSKGIKLITRLRLGLSYLREHKFKQNFKESLNPLCNCGYGIESTINYSLMKDTLSSAP